MKIKNLIKALLLFSTASFGEDLSLERAEALSLDGNKTLQAFRHIVEAGEYGFQEAIAFWLPRVDLSSRYTRFEDWSLSTTGVTDTKNLFSTSVNVSQTLFSWERWSNVCLQNLSFQEVLAQYGVLVNDTLFTLRRQYFLVVLTRSQMTVREENLRLLAEGLKRENNRLEVGDSTSFEVNRAKVAVSDAIAEYLLVERDHKIAWDGLLQLMGLNPEDRECFEISLKQLPELPSFMGKSQESLLDLGAQVGEIIHKGSLKGGDRPRVFEKEDRRYWEDLAFEMRPEIHEKGLALEKAEAAVSVQAGGFVPEVKALARYDTRNGGAPTLSQQRFSWDVGVELSWNLFEGFGNEARIGAAFQRLCSARQEFDRACQDVRVEVHEALATLEQGVLSLMAAKEGVALAELALEQANERRFLGQITGLEYRDIVNGLTESRVLADLQQFNVLVSYYNLRRISGLDLPNCL